MAATEPGDKRTPRKAEAGVPERRRDERRPLLTSVDRLDTDDDVVARLSAEVTELGERGDRLRTRLEASEREAVLLGEHLTTKGALAGELSARAALLRRELDAAHMEQARASGQLVEAREQLDRRVAELAEAQAMLAREADRYQAQLDSATARVKSLALELDKARDPITRHYAAPAESDELLAATEWTRDQYIHIVTTTAPTTLGRMAYRWQRFSEAHAGPVRVLRMPLEGAWRVLTLRWPSWIRQHPLFDVDYYVDANRDVAGGRLRPWWHYVRHGIREGRQPDRYFDRSWYLRSYPDVEVAGLDPLDHYYRRGCWEGRDPSPRFATDWYLAQHPEVAAAGICALEHFLRVGASAGYAPSPTDRRGVRGAVGGAARSSLPTPARPNVSTADPRARWPGMAAAPPGPSPLARTSPVRADVKAIRKLVAAQVPATARLGVISDGNDELLKLPGPSIVPVPRGTDGKRAPDLPRNIISARAHIEALRVSAIDFLLAPDPCLWLTAVPGLADELDGRYARLGRQGAAFLWDVRQPRAATAPEAGGVLETLRRIQDRTGDKPTVLDWDSTVDVARLRPEATTFTPPDQDRDTLVYADHSVDAVIYRGGVGRDGEARRVAGSVSIAIPSDGGAPVVEWHAQADDATTSVSVIIPTYADERMVATCLRTLDETTQGRAGVEIIVADDGSEASIVAGLESLVARYPRARLVHNATNGGYIAAVTAGAAAANHDILVFLNNDTVLLPGWLEPVADTFRRHPKTGVVGGMLLYPDGRLQEAGCAIFADGSATKIGYGDADPSLPYYAHPREVDYVSGALLATPRALFNELGGLDTAYGFGYYEDGDYCFKVRRAGRSVMYQPLSRVVHVEGGTAGLDLTQGPKAFQARNQALFIERWRDELAQQPLRPEPLDLYASRDLVIQGRHGSPPG